MADSLISIAYTKKQRVKRDTDFLLIEATIVSQGPYSPEYSKDVVNPFLEKAYNTIYEKESTYQEKEDNISDEELTELLQII